MSAATRVIAPAKVNLFLGVGASRRDGYHALDAVFHALELHDDVAIYPSSATGVTVECDSALDCPAEENLAAVAATALSVAVGRTPAFSIELAKRIPHGAGLGGGSSDAAAVITGLAHMLGTEKHDPMCIAAAQAVGADVPFFLHGGAALMTGRGDLLVRRLPALDTPLVLVRPPLPVSTAAAYRAFDAAPVPPGDPIHVIAALEAGDSEALGVALSNNFETVSAALVPQVGEALEWLRQRPGVLGATVAGSGSAVFGLVGCEETAADISAHATAEGWWSVATRLGSEGSKVVEGEGAR